LALAFARGVAVGVDVQIVDRERRVGRLAKRYFSAPEVAELETLAGDAMLTRFYQLWALKEAWTKARGESLPAALGNTTFSLREGRLQWPGSAAAGGGSLGLFDLPGYALAVCGLQSGLRLRAAHWPVGAEEAAVELCVTASAGFS
jgi:phosphopantetheinyl transferase